MKSNVVWIVTADDMSSAWASISVDRVYESEKEARQYCKLNNSNQKDYQYHTRAYEVN